MRKTESGSALVLAVFVLALVAGMGVALLFLSDTEVRLSRADQRSKRVFYLAEAGLESARETVRIANMASADPIHLSEELNTAAGPDDVIDFDPDNLVAVYDGDGNLTGLTGYDDDVPVRGLTQLGDGWFAAFMTNDPVEGRSTPTDGDNLALITGVGIGPERSMEMVQALVRRVDLFPTVPATVTVLGPDHAAMFDGGTSAAKFYTGNDYGAHCGSGSSDEIPVVGVMADPTHARGGVKKPSNYTSGTTIGEDTVADLTTDPNLEEIWTDCSRLLQFARDARQLADLVGDTNTPDTDLGTPGNEKLVFIEGDYTISGSFVGAGMLFVTGVMTMSGAGSWDGPIFVVGKGEFYRSGNGNGQIAGGIVVADVAGPDRILFTSDDCSGEDGILGNADDGAAQSIYEVNGAGNSTTGFCSGNLAAWQGRHPLKIVSFLQR